MKKKGGGGGHGHHRHRRGGGSRFIYTVPYYDEPIRQTYVTHVVRPEPVHPASSWPLIAGIALGALGLVALTVSVVK